MTTQEFIDRRKRYFKAVALRGLAVIAITMVLPQLVLIGLRLWFQSSQGNPWMSWLWVGLFILVYSTMVGVGLFSFTSYAIKIATGLGLYCPQCGRSLVAPRLTKRVIASGKCAHCGAQVLDDGP
jgi:hypothetical protein